MGCGRIPNFFLHMKTCTYSGVLVWRLMKMFNASHFMPKRKKKSHHTWTIILKRRNESSEKWSTIAPPTYQTIYIDTKIRPVDLKQSIILPNIILFDSFPPPTILSFFLNFCFRFFRVRWEIWRFRGNKFEGREK